ncbi:MAG: serine/threonine protein kinase [Myxococcales bacterium]|nr:serine/threonine protein kinase [Myxococcales bacterium]MCB9719068.1 serine/threonine protein kinase [Myxococcales bacterium]
MGRYLVKQWIARGGMAVVFRGEDERLHRPVCVKLFFGFDPSQPEFAVVLEHFVQEAFALSRLQHPATLRIFDFGYLDEEARTEPFFVTEYADSGHLGKLVEGTGGMPPDEVLRLLRPIIGALREAHAADIVHRDLKPSNILLTSAGGELSPKLADFSIAKAQGDLPNRASETNAQAPLYSLSWAAPEQLSSGRIEPAADVFALGLVVAYMLTEKLVYPGEDIMALYTLRSEGAEYRRRSIHELGLSREVEVVVQQACAEDPAARHPSVDRFFEALERAIESSRHAMSGTVLTDDVLEDDEPTGEHQALRPEDDSSPSVAEPLRPSGRPQLVPPVSPSEPLSPSSVGKPRLPLATLETPQVIVGNRRLRLLPVSNAPVELMGGLAGGPARLRITPLEIGSSLVHIKGLNCFVRPLGGRPSSGLELSRSTTLELLDPRSGANSETMVVMGPRPDGSHELELRDAIVTLPPSLTRWAVVLEAGDGSDIVLLFRPPT